jgi:putative transposase
LEHAHKIDKLNSTLTKVKNRNTRCNIRKRQFLLRTKIKNVVSDLHWKTANFLCRNFETIIIPRFGCKKMSNKNCSLSSKISRKMLLLSHGAFLEKLKFKCNEYKRKLIITREDYTSKTCTNCGERKEDLGGNKMFNCSNCKIKIDRDYNGARNILLKTLSSFI